MFRPYPLAIFRELPLACVVHVLTYILQCFFLTLFIVYLFSIPEIHQSGFKITTGTVQNES